MESFNEASTETNGSHGAKLGSLEEGGEYSYLIVLLNYPIP